MVDWQFKKSMMELRRTGKVKPDHITVIGNLASSQERIISNLRRETDDLKREVSDLKSELNELQRKMRELETLLRRTL